MSESNLKIPNIPIPNRYRRAQVLAYICRFFAAIIFIATVLVALSLFNIGATDETSFFGDTVSRITGDKLDLFLAVTLNVVAGLTLVIGFSLSLTLYIAANTLTSSVQLEKDVEIIKSLLKAQIGDEALAIEINTVEEFNAAVVEVNLKQLGIIGAATLFVCLILVVGVSLFAPNKQEAPPFIAASNCKLGDSKDSDCDGISNDQETWIAETYAPIYIYDNDEHNIVTESEGIEEFRDVVYLYQVSAVHCNTDNNTVEDSPANDALLTVVATYSYDYIPVGTGDEEDEIDILDHFGDTERTRICLERTIEETTNLDDFREVLEEGFAIKYDVAFVQLNRHEHFNTYEPRDLTWEDDTHFYLHISEGKHASYISATECAAHPRDITALVFREDCASLETAHTVIYPTLTELNVGQVDTQLVKNTTDLPDPSNAMFGIDEAIWQETQFCGGYPPDQLVAVGQTDEAETFIDNSDSQFLTILNTLLPFVDIETGTSAEVCGGSLYSKWWRPADQSGNPETN